VKIFNKGLILPPPSNFYLHFEDLQHDDDDDDDDGLPVVVAVPGKAQAFAVYIYIYMSIPKMSTIFNNELSKSRIFQVVTFRDLHYRFSSP